MTFRTLHFSTRRWLTLHTSRHWVARCVLSLVVILGCLLLFGTSPALANLDDDRFDGNIFVLYAGNASLVSPRATLVESLKREKPTLLVFYVDDSKDCKQYVTVVSGLQSVYGRAANFMAVNIDTLPLKSSYTPTEPGYYYKGLVPQTVLFDQKGEVVLNETGQVPYEQVDNKFRDVFGLVPRSESVELKRRTYNEINSGLIESER